jgi:hypothetical protein
MAHLSYMRTVYKSGSRQATNRLLYITGCTVRAWGSTEREGQEERRRREDVVMVGTCNLPAWAEGNPHSYFRAAEQYERYSPQDDTRRGIAFEEWKILLPQELSRAQNTVLVSDLIGAIAGDRLPCTYAFHEPRTLDGTQPQPHLHVLISARRNDGHVRTPVQHFQRFNRKHPERGGAQKDPAFWHKGAVKQHRLMIADMVNLHLERHGQVARVHPERLARRGFDRTPEPKLLPSESRAYRTQGMVTEAMAQVLLSRAARQGERVRERNDARQYWEQRKAELGITRDMAPAQQVARVLLSRHGEVARVPGRYRTVLERGQPPRARLQSLRGRLVQVRRRLAEEERPSGGALRIRLHEEDERERERGMGW